MARILVADDEALVRETISMICRTDAHEPLESFDTMSTVMACVQEKPDLLILDLAMPGGGGVEVLAQLRAAEELSCPVIIVSGYVSDLTIDDKNVLGAARIIEKPFPVETLRAAIREVLESAA